ncbi:MAG: UDP-glucose 4-epimerase, partial [Acidobacteria bacterium]
MRVLVTGGAGYIGSVITDQLVAGGHRVVVYDNLTKGHADAVNEDATFIQGDLLDTKALTHALTSNGVDAVVHMAAASLVGESMTNPERYYLNNVVASVCLLDALVAAQIRMVVFSSTAAVYGEPSTVPISEDDPTAPSNTYGETKLAVERALHWYHGAHAIRYASLRYFNAAGATDRRGERHDPETHLIPLVLRAARDTRYPITVFGRDYPTR